MSTKSVATENDDETDCLLPPIQQPEITELFSAGDDTVKRGPLWEQDQISDNAPRRRLRLRRKSLSCDNLYLPDIHTARGTSKPTYKRQGNRSQTFHRDDFRQASVLPLQTPQATPNVTQDGKSLSRATKASPRGSTQQSRLSTQINIVESVLADLKLTRNKQSGSQEVCYLDASLIPGTFSYFVEEYLKRSAVLWTGHLDPLLKCAMWLKHMESVGGANCSDDMFCSIQVYG